MINKLLAIWITAMLVMAASAQTLNGTWASSEGSKLEIVEVKNGFQYRNVADGSVWSTYFVGYNMNIPTYRMDLQDGSFVLYMANSKMITLSYSLNPMHVVTWKKVSNQISVVNESITIQKAKTATNNKLRIQQIDLKISELKRKIQSTQKDLAAAESRGESHPSIANSNTQQTLLRQIQIYEQQISVLEIEKIKLQ